MARFDLSDEEWAVIVPLVPKDVRGLKRKDECKVLNGIFCILHTDAPWRDNPERYDPYTSVRLQSVQPLGRAQRLEGHIRCARGGVRGQSDLHRRLDSQSSPRCEWLEFKSKLWTGAGGR